MHYLIRAEGGKAHIWTGDDTLCAMWSTNALKRSRYHVTDAPSNRSICRLCQTIADRARAWRLKAPQLIGKQA